MIIANTVSKKVIRLVDVTLKRKMKNGKAEAAHGPESRNSLSRGVKGNSSYSTVHRTTGHSTDKCYSVIDLGKKIRKSRKSGGSQPGKDARP